jgi:hypothetical protein
LQGRNKGCFVFIRTSIKGVIFCMHSYQFLFVWTGDNIIIIIIMSSLPSASDPPVSVKEQVIEGVHIANWTGTGFTDFRQATLPVLEGGEEAKSGSRGGGVLKEEESIHTRLISVAQSSILKGKRLPGPSKDLLSMRSMKLLTRHWPHRARWPSLILRSCPTLASLHRFLP